MSHNLMYLTTGTWENPCTIDSDGNVVVEWGTQKFLQIYETDLWCDLCASLVFYNDGVHNLNEYWEAI